MLRKVLKYSPVSIRLLLKMQIILILFTSFQEGIKAEIASEETDRQKPRQIFRHLK